MKQSQTLCSIYRNAGNVDAAYLRLDSDANVLAENKILTRQFIALWLAKGCTRARAVKLVYGLRKLSRLLGKPFNLATKDDLIGLVGRLDAEELSVCTKYDIKVILKTFYRWLKGEDEQYPKEIAWLKPRLKGQRHKLPEELLTEDEVLRIAQAATRPRDKALVLVLYESGCRIGEMLTLKVKHVSFDEFGAVLRVTGKTGDRRVRVISSAPALTSWLEYYEGSNDPEAYLWPPRSNNNKETGLPTVHQSVCKMLEVLSARAGVKKHVHPHLFRHSRATALATKLTEAQMKEYFGWTQGSSMAATYVHLSGRDVDKTLLSLQGLAKPVEALEDKMRIAFCQRCREKNAPTAKFCLRCGNPFGELLVSQLEATQKTSSNMLNSLMQNSEFKDFLLKKVVELGLDKPPAPT